MPRGWPHWLPLRHGAQRGGEFLVEWGTEGRAMAVRGGARRRDIEAELRVENERCTNAAASNHLHLCVFHCLPFAALLCKNCHRRWRRDIPLTLPGGERHAPRGGGSESRRLARHPPSSGIDSFWTPLHVAVADRRGGRSIRPTGAKEEQKG